MKVNFITFSPLFYLFFYHNFNLSLLLYSKFLVGEASILFLLGKTHSSWSRLTSITDNIRVKHLTVAVKLFDFLMRNNNYLKDINGEKIKLKNSQNSENLPQNGSTGFGGAFSILSKSLGLNSNQKNDEKNNNLNNNNLNNFENEIGCFGLEKLREVSLEYSVCLAELGETAMACKYVRDEIGYESDQQCNSQLLHLLSLLTSSTGDDAKVDYLHCNLFYVTLLL